ncbi:hypothetical protein OIU77_002780 [Salix suchowensis]|uniref:Uncharacterized protein n=1 Tax=Salix suchowensis TaxID=1278906 RepID=A0ABQ9AYN1_9ROSI|nr:hypothetical protein OIU77_002780 [Salix suchowensis]
MEGLFEKQAAMYLTARPGYPRKWFSKLAALSPHHYLAWDIGIGNGQATIGTLPIPFESVDVGCEDFGSFSPVNTASYEANCGFVVRGGCLRSSSVIGKVLIWLELSAKSLAGKMKLRPFLTAFSNYVEDVDMLWFFLQVSGLFDKQADLYLDGRPTYPARWYSMLADHTLHHSLAWDVGTGNGQAALGVIVLFYVVVPNHLRMVN